MSRYDIDWPLGEVERPPQADSTEATLMHESADWGPAARALLMPQLQLVEACPTPPGRHYRQHMGRWKG